MDSPAGISSVLVAISSESAGSGATWFSAGAFSAPFSAAVYMSTSAYTPGTPASTWTFSLSGAGVLAQLQEGKSYLLRAQTLDLALTTKTRVQNL
jgi:hypothetical protein